MQSRNCGARCNRYCVSEASRPVRDWGEPVVKVDRLSSDLETGTDIVTLQTILGRHIYTLSGLTYE